MFGRYALPSADLAGTATSIVASDEDAEYPAINLIAPTHSGHRNLPSRPARLTANSGAWTLDFAAPVTLEAVHVAYPHSADTLALTLTPAAGTPIPIPVGARWANGWWPSPWLTFPPQTAAAWTLDIDGGTAIPQVGRLLLYGSQGLADLGNDVRWGVVEEEVQGMIEHVTEAGVETLYELWGPRRSGVGEFALEDGTADALIALHRDARNRILPWTLIPDALVNDAWLVRFSEPRWSRTRETIGQHIFPFRVQELSRGLPWP